VALSPSTFSGDAETLVQVCKYITSGGLAALGVYSKNFNPHSALQLEVQRDYSQEKSKKSG
jgi:hypothetical protein